MKKVIALVLAVALSLSMASVAFAASWDKTDYDSSKEIKPGDKVVFAFDDFVSDSTGASDIEAPYFDDEFFKISIKYAKGKDMVKEVKFDDGELVVVLKDNIAKIPANLSNFKIEEITLTGKKSADDRVYKNKKYIVDSTAFDTAFDGVRVGYSSTDEIIDDEFDVDAIANDEYVKFKKASTSGATSYGTAFITFDGATAEVRVYDKEEFFFGTSSSPDLDIVKANPDADIEFLNFKGAPTFSSNAYVEVEAEEGDFLYEIKSGKLVKSSLKWDDDAEAFVGKVRTLGKFVISDIELVAAATTEETKNPDTGANDVVGVAVALAVVSLVAAGAVSLKK